MQKKYIELLLSEDRYNAQLSLLVGRHADYATKNESPNPSTRRSRFFTQKNSII